MVPASAFETAPSLLAPLRSDPGRAAVLTDIDGTLAPIVEHPDQAAVPEDARAALAELSGRFKVVGCVSGRRAAEARELVGIDGISYAGNHGLEILLAGEQELRIDPAIEGQEATAADYVSGLDPAQLESAGLRVEDKGPIQALHWRGADDERGAEAIAHELASAAGRAGLDPRWGRKVLELRPPGGGGKGAAVAALVESDSIRAAIYAGDDRTDLDAFRRLRELREEAQLQDVVCVGISSSEAPTELAEEADLTVEGPAGWLAILRALAG